MNEKEQAWVSWLLRQKAACLPPSNWVPFQYAQTPPLLSLLGHRRGGFGTPTEPRAAQTGLNGIPFRADYAIGITDILAILGIFGAVDNEGRTVGVNVCAGHNGVSDANPRKRACMKMRSVCVAETDSFLVAHWFLAIHHRCGAIAVGQTHTACLSSSEIGKIVPVDDI